MSNKKGEESNNTKLNKVKRYHREFMDMLLKAEEDLGTQKVFCLSCAMIGSLLKFINLYRESIDSSLYPEISEFFRGYEKMFEIYKEEIEFLRKGK